MEVKIKTADYEPSNMPYYLSYEIDPDRKELYPKQNKKNINIFNVDLDVDIDTVLDYDTPWGISEKTSNLSKVLIASDGISSFFSKENNQMQLVHPKDLTQGFLDFSTTKGEFLKRQLGSKRGFLSELKGKGINHFDDLSVGVILMEEPEHGDSGQA
jgi:hypothetical protein